VTPSFVIDVSDQYDAKRRALDCHSSQFIRRAESRRGSPRRFF
jgi:LmbE family N-acetylglucosaminyl deacetylase